MKTINYYPFTPVKIYYDAPGGSIDSYDPEVPECIVKDGIITHINDNLCEFEFELNGYMISYFEYKLLEYHGLGIIEGEGLEDRVSRIKLLIKHGGNIPTEEDYKVKGEVSQEINPFEDLPF